MDLLAWQTVFFKCDHRISSLTYSPRTLPLLDEELGYGPPLELRRVFVKGAMKAKMQNDAM